MKTGQKKLAIAIAVASIACLPAVYAKWDDGGFGVVSFDLAANPYRIIFLDNVRPAEQIPGLMATDRASYDANLLKSNTTKARNAYPAGTIPEREYDTQRSGLDYTRLTIEGGTVLTHISKSGGVTCAVNQTGCPLPGQISSTSTCNYNKVKTTLTGEISGGVEVASKINNVDTTSGVTGGVTLIKEWENGWEACQTEGLAHACPVDQNLSYDAVNYATTEARSRFGWQRLQTSGRVFYFNTRYKAADVTFCESTIGGVYVSGGFLIEPKVGKCTVNTNRTPPHFERYERMPIPNSDSNPPIAPTCRTIKKI